jgi:protein transport protein SEC31
MSVVPILKEINSASAIAWASGGPDSSLLAAGNVQGTLDDNFQTTSRLELYSTDLSSGPNTKQAYFIGSVAVSQCNFSKIAWGTKGISDQSLQYGILAGGMSTGSLNLWDAAKIPEQPESALLARVDKHSGPIQGIEFNPQQPNLLATCASDGEVLIWDLMKVSSPTSSRPSSDASPNRFGVSTLAWNPQVPYVRCFMVLTVVLIYLPSDTCIIYFERRHFCLGLETKAIDN